METLLNLLVRLIYLSLIQIELIEVRWQLERHCEDLVRLVADTDLHRPRVVSA